MPELTTTGLLGRVQDLRAHLLAQDTAVALRRCGAEWVNGRWLLRVWGTAVVLDAELVVRHAETGVALDLLTQAMVAYYLATSDGAAPVHRWIAFTELPDGRFYTQAFQGYTGRELAQVFGEDVARFGQTAVACGGIPEPFGDAAFCFWALPLVPVLAVCWQGDDEFATSYKLLFDAHTPHHLPTDACAILGSMLTKKLMRDHQ